MGLRYQLGLDPLKAQWAEHPRWHTHVLGPWHGYWLGSSVEMLALYIYLGLPTAIVLLKISPRTGPMSLLLHSVGQVVKD